MFLFASSSFAEVPVNPHFTPMSLMPRPFAASSTFDVAGIYWLPDYLGKNISRGSEDMGGGDIVKDDSDCMKHYNLYETCPSPKVSTGVVHPVAGMTCQKGCICPSEYQYTSSNCSGEYQPSGGSCDGKYNTCSPKPCSSGGYYAEQQTERICSAVTYGGRTCYSCYQPQCSAGGYETANKTGYRCAAVAYYGRTCYSCKNDTCTSGYSKSPCGSAYHQTGTTKTEAGSTCYACAAHSYSCPAETQASTSGLITPVVVSKTCSCGAKSGSCYKEGHTHSYFCPSGTQASTSGLITPVAVSKTCSCGAKSGSCYKEGHTHSYSCPSGYQSSSCSSSQVQTGTTSKVCSCGAASGTCYKCRAKTCSDGGYVSSCPSGQTGTTVSYAGLTCYSNCKANCSLPDCKDRITTKPANSSFTTSSCTDCSGTHTINTGWSCNSGYKKCDGTCIARSECCGRAPSDRPYCVSGDWNQCSQSELDDMDRYYNSCPPNLPYAVPCAAREYFCQVWCCPNPGTQCATVKTYGGCFTMY